MHGAAQTAPDAGFEVPRQAPRNIYHAWRVVRSARVSKGRRGSAEHTRPYISPMDQKMVSPE